MAAPTRAQSEQSELRTHRRVPDDQARTRISNLERTEHQAGLLHTEKRDALGAARLWHENALRGLLRVKTDEKTKASVLELLVELTEAHGLGWSDIGRLVGVSVPAIRKWRLGGDASSANHVALARLAAFMEMLQESGISDATTWLTLPFDEVEVSKVQIYRQGDSAGAAALLAFAKGHIVRDDVLAKVPVSAGSAPTSKVVEAPDGNLSIVPVRGQ